MALEAPVLKSGGSFAFQKVRNLFTAMLQEGVVGADDFKVAQRLAGANMSVDVAAGACAVQGDSTAREGLYFVVNDAAVNVAVSAAHGTLPRVDQVLLQGDTPTLSVVAGVATSGATLDNRSGAVATPASTLRKADILVPAASTSVVTANIRDRRPWARGGFRRIQRTSNAAGANDYSFGAAAGAVILVDPTNLQVRMECSGVPLRLSMYGRRYKGGGNGFIRSGYLMDGAAAEGEAATEVPREYMVDTAEAPPTVSRIMIPAAGSHLFGPAWSCDQGNLALYARPTIPVFFTVEEIVRANADNT